MRLQGQDAANRAALRLDLDAPADELETQLVDQMADLMHLARLCDIDVTSLIFDACDHFEAEVLEDQAVTA